VAVRKKGDLTCEHLSVFGERLVFLCLKFCIFLSRTVLDKLVFLLLVVTFQVVWLVQSFKSYF